MIGQLNGEVSYCSTDTVVVDVNGVGYEVQLSSSFLASLEVGVKTKMFIYTDVRENAITLFGFERPQEKEVFLLLKKAKGVGSKLALAIISSSGAEGVLSAIGRGDAKALCKVPGVGKKTAERILVELSEGVSSYATRSPEGSKIEVTSAQSGYFKASIEDDVVQALEKLGFSNEKAKKAVSDTISSLPQSGELKSGDLLREALSNL